MPNSKAKRHAQDIIEAAACLKHKALEAKNRRLAGQVNAMAKQLEEAEARFNDLTEADQHCAERKNLKPIFVPPKTKRRGGLRPATAVACASDWHVGETVELATVSGMNQYDPEVAKRRAIKFFQGVEWRIRSQRRMYDINSLVLWWGGDLVTGQIHDDLTEGNSLGAMSEMLFLNDLMTDGIKWLQEQLPDLNIRIPCNYGNHGRLTHKPRVSTAADNNLEWGFYCLAAKYLSSKTITFAIPRGAHIITQVGDFKLHSHHGDHVKYAGGVGGVDVPLRRAILQWRASEALRADMTIVGHFHCYNPGQDCVRNGSLIGYGPYSQAIRAAYEPAQQAFFLIDQTRGATQHAPIWVDK